MGESDGAGMSSCRRGVLAFLAVCLVALPAAGCFRARARTIPDPPPLDVPLPPPRLVEAAEPQPPEPVTLVDPGRHPPPLPRPAPAPQQQGETSKPEPSKPAEDPRAPATTLRTTPAEQEADLERRIRGLLLEATVNLNRIDYGRLNADAKGQYDSAKGFVRQAEDALRGRNLVFASYLADKAATLATQLRGR